MLDTVTKTFTPLHYTSHSYTSLHFTTLVDTSFPFNLHPTILHYPPIWPNPISISCRSTSPHITTLAFQMIFATFLFLSLHPVYNCFPNSLSKSKVPNASADSSFQFLMFLFTKEYFPISVLCFLSLIFRTWSQHAAPYSITGCPNDV